MKMLLKSLKMTCFNVKYFYFVWLSIEYVSTVQGRIQCNKLWLYTQFFIYKKNADEKIISKIYLFIFYTILHNKS